MNVKLVDCGYSADSTTFGFISAYPTAVADAVSLCRMVERRVFVVVNR